MKKLCIVADTYPPKKDGVLTFLRSILPYLKEHYEITLVAPAFSRDKKALSPDINVILTRYIPIEMANYYPAIPGTRVARAIKNSDIVFVHDLAPLGSSAINLARLMNKPLAVFCHHDEAGMLTQAFKLKERRFVPDRQFSSIIEKIVKKQYKAVDIFFVATSRFYLKLKKLGVEEHKIVFAPFAVDTDKFGQGNKTEMKGKLGIPEKSPVLLYLGRMSHEKNVETIIRAVPLIAERHPEAYFVFAGGGARLKGYKALAGKIAPDANIIFTDWVEWDKTPDYYSMADIFLFPSLHETQAFVTMEAMASELAVIVSKDDIIEHSYYRDGENCLFISESLNERELAEKASLLIEDSELRIRLGRAARETMLKVSWQDNADKIISGLRSIEYKENVPKKLKIKRLLINKYTGAALLAYAGTKVI